MLDAFGRLEPLVAPVRDRLRGRARVGRRAVAPRRAIADRGARLDLLTFQLNELDSAAASPARVRGSLTRRCRAGCAAAGARERRAGRATLRGKLFLAVRKRRCGLLAGLGHVWRRVAELATLDPQFQPYLDARDGIKSQLEDLALFLRRYADGDRSIPGTAAAGRGAAGASRPPEAQVRPVAGRGRRPPRRAAASSWTELQQGDDRLAQLERRAAAARVSSTWRRRRLLGQARREAARTVRARVERCSPSWPWNGRDSKCGSADGRRCSPANRRGPRRESTSREFFVSPNPGEDLRPLARIVSGGELSRMMLAIKTLMFRAESARPRTRSGGA